MSRDGIFKDDYSWAVINTDLGDKEYRFEDESNSFVLRTSKLKIKIFKNPFTGKMFSCSEVISWMHPFYDQIQQKGMSDYQADIGTTTGPVMNIMAQIVLKSMLLRMEYRFLLRQDL